MSAIRAKWAMRFLLVAGASSLLAACQTSSPYAGQNDSPVMNRPRPEFPVRQQNVPPPPAPTPNAGFDNPSAPPPPASAPLSPPISSQPLAPPTELAPPVQQPAYIPPSPPPPPREPQYRTVTIGPVVETEGPPKVYTVKDGDNLDAIARQMGTTRKALAEQNDLKEPYRIKPGQTLKGPASKNAKAYVVQQGDTLSAIGRRFSVSASALAEENDMETSDALRPGKRLLLPKGYKDNGPARVQIAQAPAPAPVYTPPPVSQPARPPVQAPPAYTPPAYTPPAYTPPAYTPPAYTPPAPTQTLPPPMPQQPAPQPQPPRPTPAGDCVSTNQLPSPLPAGFPSAAQIRQLGQGKFQWPIKGRVLTCFGPQSGVGVASNGIDIAANPNSAVRASAGGEVIHANPVRGSGLTVLVQHPDGWITIYGNLSSLSVPPRDVENPPKDSNGKVLPRTRINAGQEVGRSGGGADGQAMVHFEVRYAKDNTTARPVDPELVLPPR